MKWLEAIIISIWAILIPIHAALYASGALILVDLISGIIAARKRGEKISSAGLGRTITKVLVYQLAIITGFLCQKYLIGDLVAISQLIAGAIGVVEMKSILENLDSINGSSVFGSIINKLSSENQQNGN